MCFNISAAAWTTSLPGLRKLVFLAICDRADKTGRCWPSLDWVAKRCGISERSARSHMAALAEQGLIRREFRLGRSAVYFVNLPQPTANSAPACDELGCSAPDADTPAPTTAHAPSATPAFRAPTPAIAAQTPALDAPISNKDSINNQNTRQAPANAADVVVVDKQIMEDFAAVRKAKRRPALTHTELDALRSEGEKIGMGLSDVLKTCVIRGWTRFEAVWLPTPPPTAGHAPMRPSEPVQAPACAETVSEGVGRLASLRNAIKSAVCVTGNNSLAWAHAAIAKKQAGDYVAQTVVRQACAALRMDYRTAFD